jgi:hypothetical protein
MSVPLVITTRAPCRSMRRPTHGEMQPITRSATLKPSKTVGIAHPVSATIGVARTPRQ